jgi:hypothetical protein
MPKEKIEKVTYQVKGKFFSGEQQVNKEGIETLYANWKNACEQFNEEKLKMASKKGKTTLLSLVEGHGVKGRIKLEGSSPKKSIGGSTIMKAIEAFIKSADEIDEDDEKSLQSALKLMEKIEKEYNPANVSFMMPVYKTVERRTLKVKKVEMFGHYRTSDYVKFRKLKNKKRGKPNDKFTDPVPGHWYNKSPGEAKPPLWQALFGTKEENIELKHDGLKPILEQGIKALDDIEIDNVELSILGLGTAKRVYGIPKVKAWFKDYVYDKSKPEGQRTNNTGVNPKTGSMRDTHIANVLSTKEFKVTEPEESELIKQLGQKKGIKGEVKFYKLRIARRQVRNIGFMLGLGKIGELAVHLPTREEYNKKKEKDTKKAFIPNRNIRWMDILKAPMSEDELHERVPLKAPHEGINHWEAEDLFEERIDPLIYASRKQGNRYIRFNSPDLLGMSVEAALPLLIGWYPDFVISEYDWQPDTIDIHWTNRERPHQGGQG